MKILAVHNYYQQPGGEDQVFAAETRLLEAAGNTVIRLTETNDRVAEFHKLALARASIWNGDWYRRIHRVVTAEEPEIVHFHNTFPLISPAAYYAARQAGAAVVQTLHNYRLVCPGANLLRDGRPCEDCLHLTVPWKGVRHACYRQNRIASLGVAGMLTAHRAAGTWKRAVDAYIILTEFARSRFVAGGLPPQRLFVKPNFLHDDPGVGPGGPHFVFAGRLGREKGLDTLVDAWKQNPAFPELRILGDGDLGPWLRSQIAAVKNVVWMGRQSHERVLEEMKNACAVVLPSVCYEGFPLTVIEAFATGTPVVGSDAGTLPELIQENKTGFLFRSGDPASLANSVQKLTQNPCANKHLRASCRMEFEAYYQDERNYHLLMDIYQQAIANRRPQPIPHRTH